MTDVIERDSAIAYAISGKVREIDGERWIRIRDVRDGLMAVPKIPQSDAGIEIRSSVAQEAKRILADAGCGSVQDYFWQKIGRRPTND